MDEKFFEKIQTKPSSLKKNAALLSSQTGQSQFLVGNFSSPLIERMPARGIIEAVSLFFSFLTAQTHTPSPPPCGRRPLRNPKILLATVP